MARKNVEIAVEIPHVDRHMRHALRAIYQHHCAVCMRQSSNLFDWIYRAQRIGSMGDGDDFCTLAKQFFIFLKEELALCANRYHS